MGNTVDTIVINGKLVRTDGVHEAGVAIQDGVVVAVARDGLLPDARKVIDAGGNYIMPGFIDPHMHLQDAYYKWEQLIQSETRCAAAGGVTTIVPLLFTRADPTESYHTQFPDHIKPAGNRGAYVDWGMSGLITHDRQIDELPEYARDYGITSYKVMMAYSGEEANVFGVLPVDDAQIIRTLEQLRDIGYPGMTMIHTENMDIVYHWKKKLIATNRQDLAAYDEARPYFAEEENLRRALFFAELTNAPIYIVHMSIGTGPELVRQAKARGVKVIAETCIHYLLYCNEHPPLVPAMGKVNPPIRSKWHQDRLWEAIQRGIISTIGSDHSTLMPYKDKMKDGMWSAIPGFPGTEQILSLMASEGVDKGRISLPRLVQVCSTNVAQAFGIYPRKGDLRVGSDGDLVIVDLNKAVKISAETHHSSAGYNLYEGEVFKGRNTLTMVRGEVVYENGQVVGKPGYGQYVKRELGRMSWDDIPLVSSADTRQVNPAVLARP